MTVEEFKIIENYENYEISNMGRVRVIKTGNFLSISISQSVQLNKKTMKV
jgi:hypothetical protein